MAAIVQIIVAISHEGGAFLARIDKLEELSGESSKVKTTSSATNIAPITSALRRLIGRERTVEHPDPDDREDDHQPCAQLEPGGNAEGHRTQGVQRQCDGDDDAGRDRGAEGAPKEAGHIALTHSA